MENTPATLNSNEKARKYHFLPRKSMFGFRKNSTLSSNPSLATQSPASFATFAESFATFAVKIFNPQSAPTNRKGRKENRLTTLVQPHLRCLKPLRAASGSKASQRSCGKQTPR